MTKFKHKCPEWDFLEIDENSPEIFCCHCFKGEEFEHMRAVWERKQVEAADSFAAKGISALLASEPLRIDSNGRGRGLSPFGKIVRHQRVIQGRLLYEMAKAIGMSSAELSSVETGRAPATRDLVDAAISYLNLSEDTANELREASL